MNKEDLAVKLEKQDGIGLVRIDHPPVNTLAHPVREGLARCLDQALEDEKIQAVIIICEGRTFCAGADIKEFSQPIQAPALGEVLNKIEDCPIPVIAAIHGTALGGGLETALACHFRVAVPDASMGLPEVRLGLIPGAGGTQRLPRLIGLTAALKIITTGKFVTAEEALALGLIDELAQDGLEKCALSLAEAIIAEQRPPRRVRDLTEKIEAAGNEPDLVDNFRRSMASRFRGMEAPEAAIKAVEACLTMSFEHGLNYERTLFEGLMAGTQSAAQRYYFFAERQAAKVPDLPKHTPVQEIRQAAVIGAGTMGGGITMNFVKAGIPVTLVETTRENLDRGLNVIRKNYDVSAGKGKISPATVDQRLSMISGSLAIEDVFDADIVVEAVYEDMALKKKIFTRLDQICGPETILATNTSYLDVNELAAQTRRPDYVLGLHFFSPANVMRLLEIVRAGQTSLTVLATALKLAGKMKKIPVVVGVCHGFAGNRMFARRKREADALILEGARPEQVDQVLYDFGFPRGPFALYDLIGLDLGWSRETSTGSTIREKLCEMGRFGQKSGAGFYKYEKNSRQPIPDPEIDRLIRDFAEERGYSRRDISDREILERCLYPIINEGARILEEGIASRPGDLDVIWVNGYGWPVYRGGPMFYADSIGLGNVLETIKSYRARLGEAWEPAPLLLRLAAERKGFQDLN
ncbi:MAG: 3-hydroxyacyl-CoA dehydrogenase NAD-binding domain-containing protein [Desulfosudaceae bacterium]